MADEIDTILSQDVMMRHTQPGQRGSARDRADAGYILSREDRRHAGKLTVSRALSDEDDSRARSLAALRRAREKEKRHHMEVGPSATLESFTVVRVGFDGGPLATPVVVGLIRLDGADTCLVHRVAGDPAALSLGIAVEAVLRDPGARKGSLNDVEHFRLSRGSNSPEPPSSRGSNSPEPPPR